MILNHQQFIGLVTESDHRFLAGSFTTEFVAEGRMGETGSFLYFEGGFWDVSLDGAPRLLLTPWGSRLLGDGFTEDGPARVRHSSIPPWSLVLPRYSGFLGRADDDWQINAGHPISEQGGLLVVGVTNRVDAAFTGTLSIDPATWTISRADLRGMVQTLAVSRSTPTDADLVALEHLKRDVKTFDLA